MDCKVCFEDMQTEAFIAPKEKENDDCIDQKDNTCIRLRCGHCFHSSCVFGSFRSGMGCPICREEIGNRQGEFIYLLGEEEQEEPSEVIFELDEKRTQIRAKNPQIRKLRHELRINTRDYRLYSEVLRQKRKDFMRKALKEFRDTFKPEYNQLVSKVSNSLRKVEKAELKALSKETTREKLEEYKNTIFDYNTKDHLKCLDEEAADPILEKFWKV